MLRHRLAEKLLTDVIGLEWSRAHEEAERLEHGISAEVAELLLEALWDARAGARTVCHYSVECPPFAATMEPSGCRKRKWAILMEVLRVYEKDPKFLEFLEHLHLRPAARLRVHQREYDETMTLTGGQSGPSISASQRPAASGCAPSRSKK